VERAAHQKIMRNVYQGQLNYNNTFGKHTVGATFVAERQEERDQEQWAHSVPKTNVLPLMYFATMDTYDDKDNQLARIGYIGRVNYDFAGKYYVELSARRDASWKFAPDRSVGYFPFRIGRLENYRRRVFQEAGGYEAFWMI
jgi:hypothetical protein